MKVSATLNYLRDKGHVLTHCLPENFGDRLNTSDLRDENVCTLDRLETTHV